MVFHLFTQMIHLYFFNHMNFSYPNIHFPFLPILTFVFSQNFLHILLIALYVPLKKFQKKACNPCPILQHLKFQKWQKNYLKNAVVGLFHFILRYKELCLIDGIQWFWPYFCFQGWCNVSIVIVMVKFQFKVYFRFVEWDYFLGLQYQLRFSERS